MSIIDKLGIKPIEQFECIGSNGIRRNAVCEADKVREVEQQNRDMLEALIKIKINLGLGQTADSQIKAIAYILTSEKLAKDLIEKSDPKHRPWLVIKELVDE